MPKYTVIAEYILWGGDWNRPEVDSFYRDTLEGVSECAAREYKRGSVVRVSFVDNETGVSRKIARGEVV